MLDQKRNEIKVGDKVKFYPQNIFETNVLYSHLEIMTGRQGIVTKIVNEDQVEVQLDGDGLQLNEFTEGYFLGTDFIKEDH